MFEFGRSHIWYAPGWKIASAANSGIYAYCSHLPILYIIVFGQNQINVEFFEYSMKFPSLKNVLFLQTIMRDMRKSPMFCVCVGTKSRILLSIFIHKFLGHSTLNTTSKNQTMFIVRKKDIKSPRSFLLFSFSLYPLQRSRSLVILFSFKNGMKKVSCRPPCRQIDRQINR